MCENCMDRIGHYSSTASRPLFIFMGIVILLTLRSHRKGIGITKGYGFLPWGKNKPYSPYGSNQPMYGTSGATTQYGRSTTSQYGGATSQYGGATSQYGGATSQYGGAASNVRGSTSTYGARGASTSNNLRGSTNTYGSHASPIVAQNSAGVNTANLVDTHGSNVQVVGGLQFSDYAMITNFMGQIETVSAMESPSFVQEVLQSPGQGKILVVDGGASLNAAILDSAAVTMAQQNGWKGIIVNGAIRNADSMKNSQIGVKALGTHPSRGQQAMGQRSMALNFGGVNLSPGNWVYADKDGIVVSQTSLPVGASSGAISPPLQQQYGGGAATNSYNSAATNTYGNSAATKTYSSPNTQYGAQNQGYNGGAPIPGTTRQGQYNSGAQFGGASTPQRHGGGGSLTNSYSSQKYGAPQYGAPNYNTKPKTSKKKMISGVIFVSAVVWLCLGD